MVYSASFVVFVLACTLARWRWQRHKRRVAARHTQQSTSAAKKHGAQLCEVTKADTTVLKLRHNPMTSLRGIKAGGSTCRIPHAKWRKIWPQLCEELGEGRPSTLGCADPSKLSAPVCVQWVVADHHEYYEYVTDSGPGELREQNGLAVAVSNPVLPASSVLVSRTKPSQGARGQIKGGVSQNGKIGTPCCVLQINGQALSPVLTKAVLRATRNVCHQTSLQLEDFKKHDTQSVLRPEPLQQEFVAVSERQAASCKKQRFAGQFVSNKARFGPASSRLTGSRREFQQQRANDLSIESKINNVDESSSVGLVELGSASDVSLTRQRQQLQSQQFFMSKKSARAGVSGTRRLQARAITRIV